MKKTEIFLFVLLFSLTLPLTAVFGSSYYVSNGGSDSAAGTQSAPWARCPGMSGWNGSKTLNPGDIVYFDSAGTWGGGSGMGLLIPAGGVTYDGSSWGTGTRANLKPTNHLSRGVVLFLEDDPVNPTVIRGFEVDASVANTSGVSMKNGSDMTGATKRIEDCYVHDCGYGDGWWYGIELTPAVGRTHSNIEVLNCIVRNTYRSAIPIYPENDTSSNLLTNVLVRGCDVSGAGTNPSSSGNGIITKNHVIDVVVEYNYVHDCSGAGLGVATHSTSWAGAENTIFRYNIVKNNGGGFLVDTGGATDVMIYGNLFIQNAYTALWWYNNSGASNLSLKVYNNTFYQNTGSYEINFTNTGVFETFEFVNNIVYAYSGTTPFRTDNGSKVTRHSNNIYYRAGGGTLVNINGTYYNSGNLQSWEPSGYSSDPNFKDTASLPGGIIGTYGVNMSPDAEGLIVEFGDAVNNGTDLGTSFNGAINLSGRSSLTRPQGGSWDIGAYEYTAAGTDTTPPGAITVVRDGTDADIDSTTLATQLSANWDAAEDEESGIAGYRYAIGTSPGGSDTVKWTTVGNVLTATKTELNLKTGTVYYFSVKPVNGYLVEGIATNSNGQVVTATVGGGTTPPQTPDKVIKAWPNPFVPKSGNQMKFTNLYSDTTLKIYTLSGKLVSKQGGGGEINWDGTNANGQSITPGLYIYVATDGQGNRKTGKIAISK
jgi:hypothetical protein